MNFLKRILLIAIIEMLVYDLHAQLIFPDTNEINVGPNRVINRGEKEAGKRFNYSSTSGIVPQDRDFNAFIQIEINGSRGSYHIYFPSNGKQPSSKRVREWSCSNIKDDVITNWYMRAFGWREESEGNFRSIHGKVVKFGFNKYGEKTVIISLGNDVGTEQRLIFWKVFREIANSTEGRELLYQLLIEITRGKRLNRKTKHYDKEGKERDLRVAPLCIEYTKENKSEDGSFLIDFNDLNSEKLLFIFNLYLARLQNSSEPLYKFLFEHTNFSEISNIKNKILLEETFVRITETDCGKKLIKRILDITKEGINFPEFEQNGEVKYIALGNQSIEVLINIINARIKKRNEIFHQKLTFKFSECDACYYYQDNSLVLRTSSRNDIVVLDENKKICYEKDTPVDTALFHELLHFYHFICNPIIFYILSEKICIGKASWSLQAQEETVKFIQSEAEKSLQEEIKKLFPKYMVDTMAKLTCSIPEQRYLKDLDKTFIPFWGEDIFRKFSEIVSFHSFENEKVIVNMEEFFTVNGGQINIDGKMEEYQLSENLYRREVRPKSNTRFAHTPLAVDDSQNRK